MNKVLTFFYRIYLIVSIGLIFIINGFRRLLFGPKDAVQPILEHSEKLREIPFRKLYDVVFSQKELLCWNKIAAMIDYTYPANDKLLTRPAVKDRSEDKKDDEERVNKEMKYCVKYAAYSYFMPVLGKPEDIDIKDEDLPFWNTRAFGIYNAGYFIGIDYKNKYILLCIRGTETFGDVLTDLDAHTAKKRVWRQ